MAAKNGNSVIYSLQQTDKWNTVNVKEVAKPTTLKSGYASLTTVNVDGKTYLIGYSPTNAFLDFYEFTGSAPWIKAVSTKAQVGKGWDIIIPFTNGNEPYVACYTAKKGVFKLFSINNNLATSPQSYEFFRNHEPSLTQGFATVKTFTLFGNVIFLGYNFDNGYVATYSLSVTATSPPGMPPLLLTPTWAHKWAPGWTRFAFFQFGGENFFLKTNTDKPNVNIDHILDYLPNGTTEVATNMNDALKDAQSLNNVEPITLGSGNDPYFVTYMKKGGQMTLNRFHSDCMGWTTVATLTTKTGATQVVPLTAGKDSFLLVQ